MIRFSIACALLALSVVHAAHAEQVAANTPTLVVTATRTPVPEDQTLAAVTVIDREQIERAQVTDVAELLRFETGIELGRTGGLGGQTSAFIRGGESNHTLVLVDGIRVNPATSGGAALQHIAPHMIERIEIVRGPRSTLYGSDAIAGVINIITHQPSEAGANVFLRLGGHNTRDAGARFGFGDSDKRFSLGISRSDTDGIAARVGDDFESGYDNTTINGRGSVNLSERLTATLHLWDARGTVEYSGFGNLPLAQDFQNQVAALALEWQAAPRWLSKLTVSRGEDDNQQLQSSDFVRTVRPMVDWNNVFSIGQAQRISLGVTAQREEVDSLSFGSTIEEERDIVSAFAQDEISMGRHHVLLAVNYTDYDGFGDHVNGNVEYGFDLFTSTRLIASAATGFRAPDATDRFGFGGNPDLKPEEAENLEVGIRQGLGQWGVVDLRGFYAEVDDLISVEFDANNDPDVDFGFRAVNIDRYRNRGVELNWRFENEKWRAGLGGILQEPEDAIADTTLLRRSEKSINAHIQRQLGPAWLGIDAVGTGERPDVGATNAGYALVNLGGGIQLDKRYRMQVRVENLLGKEYFTAAGFNQPDRVVYVTLSYGI